MVFILFFSLHILLSTYVINADIVRQLTLREILVSKHLDIVFRVQAAGLIACFYTVLVEFSIDLVVEYYTVSSIFLE